MVAEHEVGILQFANSSQGFGGVLKHRFSDFHVHEVSEGGEIARIHSTQYVEPCKPSSPTEGASAPSSIEDVLGRLEAVRLPAEQLSSVRLFLESCTKRKKGGATVSSDGEDPDALNEVLLGPLSAREDRVAVHGAFAGLEACGGVETETLSLARPGEQAGGEGGATATESWIRVTGGSSQGRDAGSKRKWHAHAAWPGGSDRFTRFVLYKENQETQAILGHLSRTLRVPLSTFGIAGTKDKRGCTSQFVTASRVHPRRLAGLNARLRGASLGDFSFVPRGLQLGALQGNRFRVAFRALRVVEKEGEQAPSSSCSASVRARVEAAVQALKSSGFLNYYGMQRFGIGRTPTHVVGEALLVGDWARAVRLLLEPREDAEPALRAATEALLATLEGQEDEEAPVNRASAAEKLLTLLPRNMVAERALAEAFQAPAATKGDAALTQALRAIPRNLANLYVHAFQSAVWNAAASRRAAAHGLERAVAGDLVLPAGAADQQEEEGGEGRKRRLPIPHVVTVEEAKEGRFGIEEVVLPLPGCQVVLPQNEAQQAYAELLADKGLSVDTPRHSCAPFALDQLPGAYRCLICRPRDLAFQIVSYSDSECTLISSEAQVDARPQDPAREITDTVEPADAAARYLALDLSFALPPSSYATMLLRELTKQSTSDLHLQAHD